MSSIEDIWADKFTLICKPEQSGKTFLMIQNIIKDLREPIDDRVMVNIILCDNNLLLTNQTGTRVKHELEEFECNGEIYIEFSSHKRTKYHDACSVAGAITTKGIRNILCCTNGVRIDDIYEIIDDINRSQFTKDKIYWKIWLDEADKFTKFIDTTFITLVQKFNNISVFCITATSKRFFDRYGYMNVLPIEKTTSVNYHGWEDNVIRQIDIDMSYDNFIEHVFDNVITELKPGSTWFIPAHHKKSTHYRIKEICIERGFAVFIVNGDGLILVLPNSELFRYPKDIELNQKLRYLIIEKNLLRFPIVITGNICIGRGISIMAESFMIDYAILSVKSNHQEVSQISGRLKGNIKHWKNYKKPVVFTTPKFNSIAIEWETKSRHLAELAFKKQQEGDITIIKKCEYKTLGENYRYIKHPELFRKFSHAQTFIATKSRYMKTKTKISKKSVIHNRNGYFVTSKLLVEGNTVEDLSENDRITKSMALQIPDSRCISSTQKGSRYLILPVYENYETPGHLVQFEVRYISFID